MTERRDAADGKACRGAGLVRLGHPSVRPEALDSEAPVAGAQAEDRFPLDHEHQRLDDLRDVAADRCRGLCRRPGRSVELTYLHVDAQPAQPFLKLLGGGMHRTGRIYAPGAVTARRHNAVMVEQHFGESSPWSVGIEEELFVVDSETLLPAHVPAELLDGERRKPELFRSLVELTTSVCPTVAAAVEELAELRTDAASRLADAGLGLLASGTHPLAEPAEEELTDQPALAAFAAYAGPAARAQYCCGLHVHIGVPGADDCVGRMEAILPWLPVLLALSANSPFLAGQKTGFSSTRADLLTRLPRTGAPPAFGSYAGWETYVERLVGLGLADDYVRTWWDIRPHPRLGTLELRMPDQPTSPAIAAAFAALAQALVASSDPALTADRGVYDQNRFAALRFGSAAELVHPDGSRLSGIPELHLELVGRVAPTAERLGTTSLLTPLERLAHRTQADEQLDLGRDVGARGLTAWLVEKTAAASSMTA